MRVLQVHTTYRQRGGEDVIADGEAELVRAAGHEVLQYRVANPEGALDTLAGLALAPWNPLAAQAVRKVARGFEPDVVHIHNTWFRLSPSVVSALHGLDIPIVMTLHNFRLVCSNALLLRDGRICEDCVNTHPWRGVQHRCYRGSIALSAVAASTIALAKARHTWDRDVDCFIAPSAVVAQKASAGGIPRERVVVKPHGVGDPGTRARPPSESANVLFVGRLSPEKGVQVLLEAWAKARPDGLELLVVGDGPQRGHLEGLGVPGVRFLGWRPHDEIERLMLTARALLFPSIWYEGFASTIVEGLAAGLPVLVTDLGAASELGSMLGRRWLVPHVPDAWEESLGGLLDDAAVDAAGAMGRTLFESRFTLDLSRARLIEIYTTTIERVVREQKEGKRRDR